mmetsp:Transcript_52839/g.87765  ORF Transcript_52839/g.87765 Transcript_52839/m.87765 type:complete len:228 (-) Transcript_52839:1213-1896(-)
MVDSTAMTSNAWIKSQYAKRFCSSVSSEPRSERTRAFTCLPSNNGFWIPWMSTSRSASSKSCSESHPSPLSSRWRNALSIACDRSKSIDSICCIILSTKCSARVSSSSSPSSSASPTSGRPKAARNSRKETRPVLARSMNVTTFSSCSSESMINWPHTSCNSTRTFPASSYERNPSVSASAFSKMALSEPPSNDSLTLSLFSSSISRSRTTASRSRLLARRKDELLR